MSRWHFSYKSGPMLAYDRITEKMRDDHIKVGGTVTECTLERCWVCFRSDISPKPPILEPGQVILATSGAYSDYSVVALVRVLRLYYPERPRLNVDQLIADGIVEKAPYEEWYVGD